MKLRYLQIASSICITCCHLGMSHPALASQTYSKMLTKEYVVTKKNVNGTIVDKDGNPLIGVTIFENLTSFAFPVIRICLTLRPFLRVIDYLSTKDF